MKQDTSHSNRMKNIHQPDRTILWIAAFVAFALLCLILLLTVRPWLLKALFLLLGLAAAGYCWVMLESRRITPKPAQRSSPAVDAPAAPAEEEAQVTQEAVETAHGAQEAPQPAEQDGPMVFVSEKGDKYHLDRGCVGLRFADTVETLTEEKALSLKRKPCSKCGPKTDRA